jgi:hypothetical protein
MENKHDILLASSMFLTWLNTITQSQIIGVLTIIVIGITFYYRYLSTKHKKLEIEKEKLEIKKLEQEIEAGNK